MSINLDLDDAQAGIASVLSQFCEERCDAAVVTAQTPTTHISGEALYLNQRVDGETKGAPT